MKDKDPNEDEFNQDEQDNINEADDSFGLPDLDFNTLEEASEQEEETPEEPAESESEDVEEVEDNVPEEVVADEEDVTEELEEQGEDVSDEYEADSSAEGEDSDDETTDEESSATRRYVQPKAESNGPKIIIALVVTVIVSLGLWYFMFYKPQAAADEKARIEAVNKQNEAAKAAAAKQKQEADRLAAEKAAQQAAVEEEANEATFSAISEPTGRYYIVVESFVDSDMAADYGNELAAKGTSASLLSPKGKRKFHRLTIGDYGSFVEAQEEANKLKEEFGEDLWVLKY